MTSNATNIEFSIFWRNISTSRNIQIYSETLHRVFLDYVNFYIIYAFYSEKSYLKKKKLWYEDLCEAQNRTLRMKLSFVKEKTKLYINKVIFIFWTSVYNFCNSNIFENVVFFFYFHHPTLTKSWIVGDRWRTSLQTRSESRIDLFSEWQTPRTSAY